MASLTYQELRAIAGRVGSGERGIDDEAREHSLPELIGARRFTRSMLLALVDRWTPEQLTTRPAAADGASAGEDRWSANEAVSHLIATQNWYLLHLDRMLGRRQQYDVMPRGLGDHAHNDLPKDALAAQLAGATDRLVAYLEAIPPDADLDARRDSIFFGELSIRGWALLAIIHDLDHLAQIERLADAPHFPH
jgi:hypothetical protein